MREAIGNAFIFNIVIVFVIIVMMLLVGSLAYTKAFKVKNRIVNVIEKNDGFTLDAIEEIRRDLSSIGYRISFNSKSCKNRDDVAPIYGGNNNGDYHYCVYEYDTQRGKYYHVKTFMHFDIPIIGGFIEFPVSGETRIIYEELDG